MSKNTINSISLYYSEGSSDKVYHTQINQVADNQYVVDFQYGRRGNTLQTGSKTASPVTLEKATAIYNKLVSEKTNKGYTPESSGVLFAGTELQGKKSNHSPSLLNRIDEEMLNILLSKTDFCAQEKYDGERRIIQTTNNIIEGINKKGLFVDLPQAISDSVLNLKTDCVIDCEIIENKIYVFDILSINNTSLKDLSYQQRYQQLQSLMVNTPNMELVLTAFTSTEKETLLSKIKNNNGEGIVFKRLDAPYIVGKGHKDNYKFKLYEECTAVVSIINQDRRSVGVSLYDRDLPIFVGNVTIPPNKKIPALQDIIEVKYLYAYEGGSLYQPTFLKPRNDVDLNECTTEQLKYKPTNTPINVLEKIVEKTKPKRVTI